MPLPDHSLTIHGGCNCGAIRYKAEIPPHADRPLHPLSDAQSKGGEVRLPFIAMDHCNDCRRATGAVLPHWFCAPIEIVSASAVPRSDPGQGQQHQGNETWIPAIELFQPGAASKDTFLSFYKSSDTVTRTFCARCGTNLTYRHDGMAALGFPDMLDIVLGTVDKTNLETEYLAPDRQLWCDYGIGWVKKLATDGSGGIPRHADYHVNQVVE